MGLFGNSGEMGKVEAAGSPNPHPVTAAGGGPGAGMPTQGGPMGHMVQALMGGGHQSSPEAMSPQPQGTPPAPPQQIAGFGGPPPAEGMQHPPEQGQGVFGEMGQMFPTGIGRYL